MLKRTVTTTLALAIALCTLAVPERASALSLITPPVELPDPGSATAQCKRYQPAFPHCVEVPAGPLNTTRAE